MRHSAMQTSRFQSIVMDRINTQDDTFRITTREDVDVLAKSIQYDGLIAPPLLIRWNSAFAIVSGFRRIAACQKLNCKEVTARILKPTTSVLDCLRLAIADNALQRQLNLIETSRCLQKLSLYINNRGRLEKVAVSLGLPSNRSAVDKIKSLCLLPRPIQNSILAETVSLATAKELEALESESAISFSRLFDQLKIGLNKQKEIITFIKEIAARDGLSAKEIIEDSFFREIINEPNLDRVQMIHKLRSHLRQCRYPRLAEAQQKFEKYRKDLRLGENIKLIPPREFEATTYGLSLTFSDLTELKALQIKINKLIQNPALKKILHR